MAIEIKQVGLEALGRYGEIPIRLRVESVFRVVEVEGGLGGLRLIEEPLAAPYVKDYDKDDHPDGVMHWPQRFDVSTWLFLMVFDDERAIGGAAVAFRSPGIHMLQGRDDLAVLWDLRVHPDHRGRGIGTALFDRSAAWAREQGCTQLKVETQNINVRACRFYAARGCSLGAIDRYGYAGDTRVAHEVMLLWYLDLGERASPAG